MDPGTLFIVCLIASAWLQKGWNDGKALSQGITPPRWEKAKARSESSGRRPFREYLSCLWADGFDSAAKKHQAKQADRFAQWDARRKARQERKAGRASEKHYDPPAKPPPTPRTKSDPDPAPAPGPSAGPSEPPGVIPGMSEPVPVPPNGEINNLPALVARTNEWKTFHSVLIPGGERAKLTAESWQEAAKRGVASADASLACLATHKVKGTIVKSFTTAKEHLAQMAELEKQIAALQARVNEHNGLALAAFNLAAKELPLHEAVREAYRAAGNNAGTKEFSTSGG